jgi:hypothetical protein
MSDIKTAPLGHVFSPEELKQQCKVIYGGVSWPGKRPGFAVIAGMSYDRHFDNYDIYLLDEFESAYIREIVKQCGVLDFKYEPRAWYGDNRNDAADKFISEMNDEFVSSDENYRYFSVYSTRILEMENLYPYILEIIRELLDESRRQLFLKESRILGHLSNIEPLDASGLEFGDYPAIEALAVAVLEMRRHGSQLVANEKPRPDPYDEKS